MLGRRPNERPAGEAMPNIREISDGEAGAYCTVALVFMKKAKSDHLKHICQTHNQSTYPKIYISHLPGPLILCGKSIDICLNRTVFHSYIYSILKEPLRNTSSVYPLYSSLHENLFHPITLYGLNK